MIKEPIKFKRTVNSYRRKTANAPKPKYVKGYIQRYDSPRGRVRGVTSDILTKYSQTMWLMDKHGHFVGRANYEGKTSAKNVSKYGLDGTSSIRDTRRYKRIFGRTSNPRE
jgi:hypothetical protein